MLGPEETRRASNHMVELTLEARPGSPVAEGPGYVRIGSHRSLCVWDTAGWFDHEAGVGGRGPVSLVRHMWGCDAAEAVGRIRAHLAANPGEGRYAAIGEPETTEAHKQRAERYDRLARALLANSTPLAGTPGDAYFAGQRGLSVADPNGERLRCTTGNSYGECWVLARLICADGVTPAGVQTTAVDALGHRTLMTGDHGTTEKSPRHRYLFKDIERTGVHYRINGRPPQTAPQGGHAPDAPGAWADTVMVLEGVEDAETVALAFPFSTTIATLGVAGLLQLLLPEGSRVVIFRDSDEPGSPADRSTKDGALMLLLRGAASVTVTDTPRGANGEKEDANSLWQATIAEAAQAGAATDAQIQAAQSVIRSRVQSAKPVTATTRDVVDLLARLPLIDGESVRIHAAKLCGIRVSVLDRLIKAKGSEGGQADTDGHDLLDPEALRKKWNLPEPWPDPVPDIVAIAEVVRGRLSRYVYADQRDIDLSFLWSVSTHFVHHPVIIINTAPRLSIRATTFGSGKTTLLYLLAPLCKDGLVVSNLTSAFLFRFMDLVHPTLLFDEGQETLMKTDPDMRSIILANHTRGAWVGRVEEVHTKQGRKHVPDLFNAWGTFAYTLMLDSEANAAMESRALTVMLPKAKAGEVKERPRDGKAPELVEAGRKIMRFAMDLTDLPDAPLPPTTINRDADNWRLIYAVAHAIGGDWPARAEAAAELAVERAKQRPMGTAQGGRPSVSCTTV
jgi:hypothetical protein